MKFFWKSGFFRWQIIFRTILKNRKFQKVTFFENFEKSNILTFSTFSKKVDFLKCSMFFEKKVTFWNFRVFKIFWNFIFIEKITFSEIFQFFIILSYLMYNLSEWHRGTPTVPPVGAVNAPLIIWKIKKNHIFEDFWELFFLIHYIGFSLKYENPKSSTEFFHRKNHFFRKFSVFYYFIVSHV